MQLYQVFRFEKLLLAIGRQSMGSSIANAKPVRAEVY